MVQPLQRPVQDAPKIANAFYQSRAWREARDLALVLGQFRCAHCTRSGCRLYVDHITELADGGAPYAQDNLEPICGSCHTTKTRRSRDARMATPAQIQR